MDTKSDSNNIPQNWVWTTIESLGIVLSGGTPSTKDPRFWNGSIPWITPADLSGYKDKYIGHGKRALTELGLDHSSAVLLPSDTILFSSRAPIGYVAIAQNPLTTNQGFKNLIPMPSILPDYIYYYLQTAKQIAESMASGTTFLEISGSSFGKIPFPLAPLSEQKRVVEKIEELLSELKQIDSSLKKAKEQLEIYRQSILTAAFSGNLSLKWRKENPMDSASLMLEEILNSRNSEFELALAKWKKQYSNWKKNKRGKRPQRPSPPEKELLITSKEIKLLGKLPQTWSWAKLGNFSYVTKLAGFEFSKFVSYSNAGTIPVIKAQNVGKSEFSEIYTSFVSDETLENLPRIQLNGGELLFVFIGAGIGNVAIVPRGKKFLLGPNVALIRLTLPIINKYIEYFLSSKEGKRYISELTRSTAQGSISMENIRKINIPIAPLAEQIQIVEDLEYKFTIASNLEKVVDRELTNTGLLRQIILNKAFRGGLAPQYIEDISAVDLLKQLTEEKNDYLLKSKGNNIKTKKKLLMEQKKTIVEILYGANRPILTETVWQQSIHSSEIEEFYAELKKLIESKLVIEAPRNGKDTFLIIGPAANAN